MPINLEYPGAECPDCGEPIPDEAEGGSECENCGHVFQTTSSLFHQWVNGNCKEVVEELIKSKRSDLVDFIVELSKNQSIDIETFKKMLISRNN